MPTRPIHSRYETRGAEILQDTLEVDVCVVGLASGGILMGVRRRLTKRNPAVKSAVVEPSSGSKLHGLRNLADDCCMPPFLDVARLDGRRLMYGSDEFGVWQGTGDENAPAKLTRGG